MDKGSDSTKEISENLIDAAAKLDLEEAKKLLALGANPNHVRYTDSDCWYAGNTHTPLYVAVNGDF